MVGAYSDAQAAAVTLIENIQRQDLNGLEEAAGYQRLLDDFHFNQAEIATLVGKSRSHVANLMRLLTLCEAVQAMIRDQSLSLGHARVLVGLSPDQQRRLAQDSRSRSWSVRRLEDEVRRLQQAPQVKDVGDADRRRLEVLLAEQMGTPVRILSEEGAGGWLTLKFFDHDTLSGLLERMGLRYD